MRRGYEKVVSEALKVTRHKHTRARKQNCHNFCSYIFSLKLKVNWKRFLVRKIGYYVTTFIWSSTLVNLFWTLFNILKFFFNVLKCIKNKFTLQAMFNTWLHQTRSHFCVFSIFKVLLYTFIVNFWIICWSQQKFKLLTVSPY